MSPPVDDGPRDSVSLADRVTDELRRAILAHEFLPGDRLGAASLADRFDVSATPLREAFARLAGEGWVTYQPQRGVRVAEVRVEEMLEIYELRMLLEPLALRRSVLTGDDAWRDEVAEAHRAMEEASCIPAADMDGRAYAQYEELHVAFHQVTLSRCGSAWLIRITDLLTNQSRRFRRLSLPIRARYGSVPAEHRAIADACTQGDADAAVEAGITHMENTRKAILSWAGDPGNRPS
jgi:GntR family carbon starvation induced transcriptional regulator